MKRKIIAVDFDGTLCSNKWPEIGQPNLELIQHLKDEKKKGSAIILWTCRTKEALTEAIGWSLDKGLSFDAVNDNIQEIKDEFDGESRKIFATEYIDDRMSTEFKLPFTGFSPFYQKVCDHKCWEASAADASCQDDCKMECPYRKYHLKTKRGQAL